MKYLGVAYACVVAVVAAAAIYLLEPHGVVAPAETAGMNLTAKSLDTPTPSARLDALSQRELPRLRAAQASNHSVETTNAVAAADVASGLPSAAPLSAKSPESSQDERPLMAKEPAATDGLKTEQTKLDESTHDGVQPAPDGLAVTAARDVDDPAPLKDQARVDATSDEPTAMSDAASQHEQLPLPEDKAAIDAPKTEAAIRDRDDVVPSDAGGEAKVSADLQSVPATAAYLGAPDRAEASLPHEGGAAGDAPKPDYARFEENSSESAEQPASFQTASVGDFEYVAPPNAAVEVDAVAALPDVIEPIVVPSPVSRHEPMTDAQKTEQAKLEESTSSARDLASDSTPTKRTYLAYYVYDERPPGRKPAQMALDTLKDVPVGTPLQEIKRAAAAFGLDYNFMKAVAKVESDFDPKQRTGSYIGLFQLSHYEFAKYGSGDILNPRDNAMAAAYKFINDATQFEWDTHKNPTFSDMYLIHQQGWQGAAEHVSHPEWIAWKSMCATDEGKEKGEKWCKRAVWQNTLPAIKQMWKSVENLTSSAFVYMWRQRIDRLYARYSDIVTAKQDVEVSRPRPKALESHCAKPSNCHSQLSGKSVSNKSLRQRVSHSRRRLVPGGNPRNVHAFICVGMHDA